MSRDECLLVADSRIQGWLPPQYPGWRVRTLSRPGGQLSTILKLATESLRPATRMLVIMALHCDLTYLTSYSEARPRGLMRLLHEPPLADICNVVTTKDREWRLHHSLQVVWVLPYVPNFLLYNQQRARYLNMGALGLFLEEEFLWSARQMAIYLQQLADKLRLQGLTIVELLGAVPLLTADLGSDGVHMGTVLRQEVMHRVMQEALNSAPIVLPTAVGPVLSVTQRWRKRHRRYRYRRNRRAARYGGPSPALAQIGSAFIRDNVPHLASLGTPAVARPLLTPVGDESLAETNRLRMLLLDQLDALNS